MSNIQAFERVLYYVALNNEISNRRRRDLNPCTQSRTLRLQHQIKTNERDDVASLTRLEYDGHDGRGGRI